MDTTQKREYYNFAKAAAAGGADWICLWGVADNTNAYWRMGQNALLFNEQYQPKPAYHGFYQGIKDGLAIVKADNFKPAVRSSENIAPRIAGTKIYIDDIIFSHCNLFDISGKRIKTADSQRNWIDIGHISKGVYFLEIFTKTSERKIFAISR